MMDDSHDLLAMVEQTTGDTDMVHQEPQQVKQQTSKIEVIDIRPAKYGYGSVKALARIRVGALVIGGVKVIQQDGQRAWVRLPDAQNESTQKWYPIVSCLSPTLEAAISNAVLEAWRAKEAVR